MNSNWSYSPETKIWVVTSVTLTFDLWPWPFAWTLPWSNVITPENFMMIRWWEHSQKGVTDGQTDRQTDRRTENTIHRAAWSQLKIFVQEKAFKNVVFEMAAIMSRGRWVNCSLSTVPNTNSNSNSSSSSSWWPGTVLCVVMIQVLVP